MPVISVTRLRVRSWRFLPPFVLTSLRIAEQARRAEGNLAAKLFRDARLAFWTCTCWTSEAAMKSFMLAKPHGPAMRRLLEWCDEAAVVHWTQAHNQLPSWTEAHRRIQQEGRLSRVNHPSEAQRAFRIDAPRNDARRERLLK